ncbi:MAG: gliding motility lipoprotein GldH [Bacteroidales bacterium]
MINQLSNKNRSRINLTLIIIFIFISGGCKDPYQNVYYASRDVSALKWDSADTLSWLIPGLDPASRYDMAIDVRHDDSYPYQNVGMEITWLKGDTLIIRDTLDMKLTKPEGNWKGDGWGSLYEVTEFYKEVDLPYRGDYTLYIRPCMDVRKLKGIYSIGFELRKK